MFTFLTNFCCSKQAVANRIFEKKFSLPTTQNVGNIKYLWSLDWKMGFFALTIFFFSKFVSLKIVSLKTSFQWIIILLSMAIQKRPICHEVNISFLFSRDLIRFLLKCVLIHGKIFLWYSYIWHTFPIIVTFGVKCDFFIINMLIALGSTSVFGIASLPCHWTVLIKPHNAHFRV